MNEAFYKYVVEPNKGKEFVDCIWQTATGSARRTT